MTYDDMIVDETIVHSHYQNEIFKLFILLRILSEVK